MVDGPHSAPCTDIPFYKTVMLVSPFEPGGRTAFRSHPNSSMLIHPVSSSTAFTDQRDDT